MTATVPSDPAQGNAVSMFLVRCTGELDIADAARLRDDLMAAIDSPSHRVIVDLSQVTFLDASILGVLAGAAADLRAAGRSLEVINPCPGVVRLLRLTGLDEVLIPTH
jgi:anti-sigma B factor antagonist